MGVGPGDAELMTVKALRRIEESPVIAVPAREKEKSAAYKIAAKIVKDIGKKEILCIDMPMTRDKEKLAAAHRAGAALLTGVLRQGKDVAFLTLGDPCIYSTYLYLHRLVKAEGYEAGIISGIPSFCAAGALMGLGLTEGEEQLHIIPSSAQIEEALRLSGTKILMKAGKRMPQVKRALAGLDREVYMVENCGMEQEKIYCGVEEIPDDAGYYSLIIVKDGRAVG